MAQRRTIESLHYPYLQISWRVRDVEQEGLAYVDTGFDGHLAIPESAAGLLGLPDLLIPYRLASNQQVSAPAYAGSITLLGWSLLPATIIAMGSEMILGRRIIDSFRVTFDHGRRILVEP
ncbi:MAG: hypothetical protein HW403_1030 [Dehalococcoidia bacterium]|nr:hypothetical protein [Dehalococcoidia bacterium]